MRTYPVTAWVFFVAAASSVTQAASHACSPDLQVSWVVSNSATASELARAANCSGGAFDVEWIGHVEFPETIYVIDETVMNITGAGAGAIADGADTNQFLNVVNATLRVQGLRIQNCATLDSGGAIYAEASTMAFNETTWSNNTATEDGGAVAVINSSSVSWRGETTWSHNTAGEHGGAVAVGGSSDVSWSGDMTWSYNTASSTGGAVTIATSSSVSWSGEMTWSHNTGNTSGAVHVYDSSDMSWSGEMTWADNSGLYGGAVQVYLSSGVSWSGETMFFNNNAKEGGAVGVYESSHVSWSGETTGSDNNASLGGAILVWESSDVSWSGRTTWSTNTAGEEGGAVWVGRSSDVSWSGETTGSDNNALYGGAILVGGSSDVSWSGRTTWSTNTAGEEGGAVWVGGSSDVSWSGQATWSDNTASEEGGVVALFNSSNVSWSGKTTWSGNTGNHGGAVLVSDSSNVSWSGEATWYNNTAGLYGGAIRVEESSSDVSWVGDMTWSNNTASSQGGAVDVVNSTNVSWSGDMTWSDNTGGASGGAVTVLADSSDVSWSGDMTWSYNHASRGGAVFVLDSSNVAWSGEMRWSSNTAEEEGGAIYIQDSSDVSWSGETTWSYNTAGLNGGAIYVFSSAGFILNSSLFEGNAADAGGAVMLSGVDVGPEFVQTNFTANSSPRGGAVYSVSSGIATDNSGDPVFPIVYKDCLFMRNRATSTGGAIETVAGYDRAVQTVFEGNTAGVGGALRLAGSATLTNCSFIDNSAEDQGPAISNLGVLDVEGNASRFSGNFFSCEIGMYLDSADGNRFQTVCDGCPDENNGTEVENEDRVPICKVQPEHTRSAGGDTTIETLDLDAGYWRSTNDSSNVQACYNEDACNGGMTDDPAFCQLGYEGPYCSVCSGGYSTSLAFTCAKCVDDGGGMAILVVVGVVVLGAAIALFMYLVSGEMEGARRGTIHRVIKLLPLQSIKIVVVVWQILTQFASVANVTYPDVYQRFLDGVSILNFDALWIPSAGCIVEVDFHGRLLVSTIGPLVILALLAISYAVAKRRNYGSEAALQKVGQKHMSMVLLISFLVYSSVSATIFQTFACEHLHGGWEYLRADYRIECDSSEHRAYQVYAGIMIMVYPVGIPFFYAYLLSKNRLVLKCEDGVTRETSSQVQAISDLWAPYKPGRFYYEVIECLRRITLTGVVVFIYPNTAAQVAVTLVMAFAFVVVSERLAPYVSKWDASVSLTGHIIVFVSMYVALLSKVDVSDERAESQKVFAGILVAAHAGMVVVVVIETVVIFLSMWRNEGPVARDSPRPRVQCKESFPPCEDPFCRSLRC